MEIDDLTLQTGVDIELDDPHLILHQPKVTEIAEIGYNTFYQSAMLLSYPERIVEKLGSQKQQVPPATLLAYCFLDKSPQGEQIKVKLTSFFQLVFPNYQIKATQQGFIFFKEGAQPTSLNDFNYENLKKVIIKMLQLEITAGKQFNPSGALAKEYAQKIMAGRERIAKLRGKQNDDNINPFAYYISILAVGLGKDKNQLKEYTIPQLVDEYKRFSLKESFDIYIKRATSFGGVKKGEKVPQWTGNLNGNNND